MEDDHGLQRRHFVSYSGVTLPLNLITPLDEEGLDKRITYMRGYYNAQDQLMRLEKVVYGEVEFEHRYEYHEDGRIKTAQLLEPDEEPNIMHFE